MLPRAAHRLETTLLLSRQSLPRPARLYSTPSRKASAPGLATVHVPFSEYPAFLSQEQASSTLRQDNTLTLRDEIGQFLNRKVQYTKLPPPQFGPTGRHVPEVINPHFPSSAQQELISVMEACLHNLYNVGRAKGIFDRMRAIRHPLLNAHVYNEILEAYFHTAAKAEGGEREHWLIELWEVYNAMEGANEGVTPNEKSYAIILKAWNKYNPDSTISVDMPDAKPPTVILGRFMDRQLSLHNLLGSPIFDSEQEMAEIVTLLSKAAVDLNIPQIVLQLGQNQAQNSQQVDHLSDVPEVMPVMRQKKTQGDEAEGTVPEMEVPFNLTNLRQHLADVTLARRALSDDLAARQKMLEESVYDVAKERLKYTSEKLEALGLANSHLHQLDIRKWMWDWNLKLKDRLESEIHAITIAESIKCNPPMSLAPYLSVVNPERLSLITILELMHLIGTGGVTDGMKTTRALLSVGKAVEVEYKAQMCKANSIPLPSGKLNDLRFFTSLGYRNLRESRALAAKQGADAQPWTAVWPHVIRAKVGAILVECLMDVAEVQRTAIDKKTMKTVTEFQPAFIHAYEYSRGQKLGVLKLNTIVADRLAKDSVRDTLHPRHLPMLVKPKPWINYDQGGYLNNQTFAMRFKESVEQEVYLKQASEHGHVELVYAGLDVLGSTPWKINKKVFDVVLTVWNSGARVGKVPPAVYDKPEPVLAEGADKDLKARSVYIQRQRAYIQGKANNHSDRCSVNYKIEIARTFLGDTLYFPHNLDFRGRAYPLPAHLSHIGDDLCRGLLLFQEEKPLGERGLRWLKIHLANLYGYDKAMFDERVTWVEERLADIYDSATNPLEGRRWWLQAGDPWQCLACCMELHAALTSPDPHAFMSTLPVHQDGTCNGLQHYAALGGDARGAEQVNLAVSDRPSDVYSHVGRMVEEMIEKDVEEGEPVAILLKGKITRKVVKQTVMTTVYGVTFIGARSQIEKQLKDRGDINSEDCWAASTYLARKVLICIGDLFSGAKDIQVWLNLCARLIAKAIPEDRLFKPVSKDSDEVRRIAANELKKEQMTSVVWTTPLGLPIVQPYRKIARKQVMTSLQSVYLSDPNSPAEVNSLKQASAFPPNFIHSLDATHMMLTALECRSNGLTFASVHDSYWTHAKDIDKMSDIIRETFIALHSSDVLRKLRQEFIERYKGYKIPLTSIQNGKIIKMLANAGSRIIATPEQAKSLSILKDLLVISDTQTSTVGEAEGNATEVLSELVDAGLLNAAETRDRSKSVGQSKEDSENDDIKSQTRAAKVKAKQEELAKELAGKFIDLADILPPLPKKGSFNVETIKASPYFFS